VEKKDKLVELDISSVKPSEFQPRRHFDREKLEELALSLKNQGVIQPIVVSPSDGGYVLIAGERRWRAAQLAGLLKIPAIVRDLSSEQKAEFAIIENIQRQDLNPVEEAMAYKTLIEKFNLTQEELSEKLGKKRATIANLIRILTLPEKVLAYVEDGSVSVGHAKVLTGLTDKKQLLGLADEVVTRGLTVRNLEKKLATVGPKKKDKKPVKDVFLKDGAERLTKRFGSSVDIKGSQNKGVISIQYHSKEQLQSLFDELMKR
jgi:ParB family chromosome partitioning protein